MFDDLTPLGRDLAGFYEENVKSAEYLRKHTQDEDIKKAVLIEYGNSACICRLNEPSKERNLLREVMFSKNFTSPLLEKSRKETLGSVLSMVKQCNELDIDFSSDVFRDAVYFGQASDGETVSDLNLKGFEEITSRWRLFQLHEYLTYALESLLHALISQLKRKDEGLSIDDFLALIVTPSVALASKLMVKEPTTFEELVGLVLKEFGVDELSQETSLEFPKRCNLQSPFSEKLAFKALQKANKSGDLKEIVANSMAILTLNYIRSFHLLSSVDPVTLWFNNRAIVDWSPVFFAQEIKSKASKWSIDYLVRYYFKSIVERHDLIAYEKLLAGNDTFRFEEKAGRLRFKMDIYPNYPTQRSSRMDSAVSVLEQLGLIETQSSVKTLTTDGERFLGECLK